jgi:quercetin dioxygenase-like cupin family protein
METTMPVLQQLLGKVPSGPKSRVRNFIANKALGTERSDIHENVINPGVTVPWHFHATEEVIVVLEGQESAGPTREAKHIVQATSSFCRLV